MKAMVLERAGGPLLPTEAPMPKPDDGQVLLRVIACGVCRTDLHLFDGELPDARYPIIPGHEIVGEVVERGPGAGALRVGTRVGVGWLGSTCGRCEYCAGGNENLCEAARFTGCQLDGGYAQYAVADASYCFTIPEGYTDMQAAPLLCAGLIGYRALRAAGDGPRLGLYGVGAAAHIIIQVALHQGRRVYGFSREGDEASQRFARELGAVWAGASTTQPPEQLDAAIIFAPVGALVPEALRAVRPGGRVVCAGIHMSDIPSFPYELLWKERTLQSVANLTRADGEEFLELVSGAGVHTHVTEFPLERANEALEALRGGRFQGAAVLRCTL